MDNKPLFKRRRYFINKRFQTDFSIRFLIVIVIEALLAGGLFFYMSKGTLTTGYSGTEFKVARTYEFFLPMLFFSNIVIIGLSSLIGVGVLIFISHRIAGPLYGFEKAIGEISKGNLLYKFKIRKRDQFVELADCINKLADIMDKNVGNLKAGMVDISELFAKLETITISESVANNEVKHLMQEIHKKLREIKETADYFHTSQDQNPRMP